MACPGCGRPAAAGARFCQECGTRLPAACAGCGTPLAADARFCPACGRAVGSPAAPPPATPEAAPAAYTPRHLAERILASRSAIEGEHKPVTVLFCDLVSSTALAGSLGPEGMHALLGRFFEAALAEVHRYEGTINQFLGDGFMALFGAPLAHEDHARRAALAALAIRRALEAGPLEPEPGRPVTVRVRMGLHTGQVVVGAIGDNLRMDYTAVGDTTHLAARLQQLAEPGTICASEATARLVRGYVELEPLGPVTLRGLRDPVPVSRILGPGPRRAPLAEPGAPPLTPFVGRGRELGTLLDLLARAEAGEGQAAGIVGEPGVGKSRLLLELRQRLDGRAVAYLEGRCLSFGSAIPYLPVLDLVRGHAGLTEGEPPETVTARVREAIRRAGAAPDALGPPLLDLLGVTSGAEALAALGPEAVKGRRFDVLRQLFLRASLRQPLVLVVEDLHWVDGTSEELLASLAEQLSDARILLLATYRPGYRPPWMDRSYATQLSLARLAAPDSLSVVRAILPEAGLADPTARLILDKAEGNPFFLEELARAVGEAGPARPALAVPDTVQGVLAARIDRLPEPAKRLLQTASVLGREFPRRLLQALWAEGDAAPLLRELVRQEFLREGTSGEEPSYAFKHALTQDVALAGLLAPRRRELHRRAAVALLALDPGRERELAPVLAHHYVEAEAWAEAAEHARRAAEAAARAYANREALERYDQALAAATRAGLAPAARLGLHEARAAVHAILGAFAPARADLEAALALAGATGAPATRARLLGALAALWGGHKDYARGLELAREAVQAGEAAGEPGALAEALFRLGLMAANVARLAESRQALERALATFRAAGDPRGEAQTLDVLGMVELVAGDFEAGVRRSEAAVRRLVEIGDRETEASALTSLAAANAFAGRCDAADAHLGRAIELARLIGSPASEAFCYGIAGEAFEPYGQWGRAWAAVRRGLEIARSIGHLEWMILTLSVGGRIRRNVGDLEGARRLHEEELAVASELGATLWIADALGELGQDHLAAGELDAAAAHLTQAIEMAGEAHKFILRSLLARAELALRRADPAAVLDLLAAARPILGSFRVYAIEAVRLEGDALATLGRTGEAEVRLRQARADAEAIGAAPVRWRACLALDGLLRASGRPREARELRREARALLDAVAAELPDDLRRCFEGSAPVALARAPDVC